MPGPHHRRREYAGPGAVAEALLNPAWSHLEPSPPRVQAERPDVLGRRAEVPAGQ